MIDKLKQIWYKLYPQYEIYKVEIATWTIHYTSDYCEPYRTNEKSVYEILYSSRLNKYVLQIYGYKPREHQYYSIMVDKVNKLNGWSEFKV